MQSYGVPYNRGLSFNRASYKRDYIVIFKSHQINGRFDE